MTKKGQESLIVALFIFLAVALLFGGIFLGTSFTGNVIKKCDIREAKYTIISKTEFIGGGIKDGKFNVQLKNDENQAAKFKINMLCNTATKSKVISSSEFYVQPHAVQDFSISYSVGFLEDWKCVLSSVNAATIDTCEEIN
tara:strand:- start:1841 stop:2263 length:423 start_codon:yes stop_codon:yes gene_type:complete